MNKNNLKLLGLEEGATKEEIKAAYDTLRAKYLEERFLDGEVGNNAAAMLTKIDSAYNELITEINEASDGFADAGDAYAKVEELIKNGDLNEAQRVLDSFNERNAQWHYLQSVVFYRKNWVNESKKQLEIAMRLDGDNAKYKEAYKKLNEKIEYDAKNHTGEGANQSVYQGQDMNGYQSDQMGDGLCAQCAQCIACNMCLNCMCNGCCR